MLSSQSFLWINLGFALALAGLFLVGRVRIREPSRLRLYRQSGQSSNELGTKRQGSPSTGGLRPTSNETSFGVKDLNVIFIYNGHSFDAHEVLGVPAGASLERVREAYFVSLQNSSPESREFIELAFRSICA